jgi:hypothetical protein
MENEDTEEREDIDKPTYEEMIEVISNMKNGKTPPRVVAPSEEEEKLRTVSVSQRTLLHGVSR